jgi:nucleoside-diphosphate-sugar epimerase
MECTSCTRTFVIGASGAIGRELTLALARANGGASVVCAIHRTPLPLDLQRLGVRTAKVDVRDAASLEAAINAHEPTHVWNLAAPLSVETDNDPALAREVTVGGMRRIIDAMAAGSPRCRTLLFSDSIGSFGAKAPREGASARWLVENPTQDPGSDYGRQKRACRELLSGHARSLGIDARWIVIPGVLHGNVAWGDGTTEYALDAIRWAVEKSSSPRLGARGLGMSPPAYVCPIDLDTRLPMILVRDLIRAMLALQAAPRSALLEPTAGYAAAGLSFTPRELFARIRARIPGFRFAAHGVAEAVGAAARFATLWPDTLSPAAAHRDLGFRADATLSVVVDEVIAAHRVHFGARAVCKL